MNTNKFIDFIITQQCTYRCEYCSQSKIHQCKYKYADKKTIFSFLNFLDKLDKGFEITITGGEAILHSDFFYLITEIKNKGFMINLITNLSSSIEKYIKIFNLINNNLNHYDISIHLDEIKDFDEFIKKCEKFIIEKPENTKVTFNIPIYKLDKFKEEKIKIIQNIAAKYSINCNFQHIRLLNQYVKYNTEEQKYFKGETIIKSFARNCLAGKYSAVIYEDGNVYRCYSSRFTRTNYLGNINDKNFKLNRNISPCVFKNCTCPKPNMYNQLKDSRNYPKALIMKLFNIVYMPFVILKNRDIIKAKLKHFSKIRL